MLRPTPNPSVRWGSPGFRARGRDSPVLASRKRRESSRRHFLTVALVASLVRLFARSPARSFALSFGWLNYPVRRFAHVCYVFAKCIGWDSRICYSCLAVLSYFILHHFLFSTAATVVVTAIAAAAAAVTAVVVIIIIVIIIIIIIIIILVAMLKFFFVSRGSRLSPLHGLFWPPSTCSSRARDLWSVCPWYTWLAATAASSRRGFFWQDLFRRIRESWIAEILTAITGAMCSLPLCTDIFAF